METGKDDLVFVDECYVVYALTKERQDGPFVHRVGVIAIYGDWSHGLCVRSHSTRLNVVAVRTSCEINII